ncbi:MAG: hypothetical protein WHX93_08580 [bacterium]
MIFRLLTLIGLLLFSDATSAPAQHAHSGSYGSSSLGDWIQLGQPVSSGGLQVHFRMSATGSRFLKGVSPGELELGFRLDWEDGKGPAIGLEPFAWIARATDSSGAWDAQSCQEAVSRMARGGMESEEAIALNKMQILTLNQDQSLSVINPRVSLATANIESIIPLGGRPVEALVDERRGLLFMLLEKTRTPFGPGSSEAIPAAVGAGGEKGELAVFDLQGNRIRGRLELKGLPHKFFADKELELLWITSSSGEVTLVESQGLRIIRSFRWGQGPVEAQFDPSGTRVFLASSTETHLKVMDARRGGLLGNIDVPREGLKLASSAHTGRTYAVDSKGGGVLVLDSSTLMVLGTIALAPGVASVKISPDGRFLLALFPEKRALAVVDLERGAVVQRGRIGQGPEQLEFTQHYGYVHHPKSAQITIFRQADLGNGPELPVLEIPVGSNSDEMIPKASNLNKMAIMHGHGGALIAHGGDRMIYHYMEGMMAPMSGLKLQTSPPLGILIYHRRMQEGPEPGQYRARVSLSQGGPYQVLFHLPFPKASACFDLVVEGTGDMEKPQAQRIALVARQEKLFLDSPGPVPVAFEIRDETRGLAIGDLKDLRVIIFATQGNWQWRAGASEVEPGLYQVKVRFPRAGHYLLVAESASLGAKWGGLRHITLKVEGKNLDPTEISGKAP